MARQKIANGPNTHNTPPHNLTIQLINWQVLTGKGGQLKEDKLTAACQAATESKVDIILGTELGTTPMTEPLNEGPYVSDWSTHPKVKAGQGVGAFFSKSASFSWAPLSTEEDASQRHFYHLMHNNQSLLLGIFYAPHARKPQLARSKFYETLFSTWMTHRQALPGAIRILAGDTNLPELQYDSNGSMTPTDSISRYWCEQFMPGMLCANCHKGKPAATHQADNTLDLIIYSPELCLEQCTVGELMATDHHPVLAKFQWVYKANNQGTKWQPAKQVSQQQFDADMSAPLAALHEWARMKIQDTKQPTPLAQRTDQYAVLM